MAENTDLTGQVFNKWTVLGPAPKREGSKNKYWRCRCICGNESEVDTYSLKHNKSKGCSFCRNSKDYTGQRFNHLTALRNTYKIKHHCFVWECQCDCGNIIELPSKQMIY